MPTLERDYHNHGHNSKNPSDKDYEECKGCHENCLPKDLKNGACHSCRFHQDEATEDMAPPNTRHRPNRYMKVSRQMGGR